MNAESRWSRLLPRFQLADPGLAALKTAARAAIVMPLVFAFAGAILLMVMLRRSDVQPVEAQIDVEEPLEAAA